jgi:hypothetical protein
VASEVLTIPDQSQPGNARYSSTLTTDGARLTTMQLDFADFSGNVSVQGASFSADTNGEWYDIPFQDLDTGNTVNQLELASATKRRGINISGYHPYIRLELDITGGNVDLITYR